MFRLSLASKTATAFFQFENTLKSVLPRTIKVVADPVDADLVIALRDPRLSLFAAGERRDVFFIPRNWNLGGGVRIEREWTPITLADPIDLTPLTQSARYGGFVSTLPDGDPRSSPDFIVDALTRWMSRIWPNLRERQEARNFLFSGVTYQTPPFHQKRIAVVSSRIDLLRLAAEEFGATNEVHQFMSYRTAFLALKHRRYDMVFAEQSMPWEPPDVNDLTHSAMRYRPIGSDTRIGSRIVSYASRRGASSVFLIGNAAETTPTVGVQYRGATQVNTFGAAMHWDLAPPFSWAQIYTYFKSPGSVGKVIMVP